jgi:cyanophycin synthetase
MVLDRQGLTLDAVPEAGKLVYLRENANLSTGGVAVDATDEICAENQRLCLRAAQAVGLDVAGVDLVVENPGRPAVQTGGAVIEVNAAPGIRMHHYPMSGQPRDAAGAIVDWLFPEGSSARIPIVSVTGTNGKTTTTRMVAHILSATGLTVGVTTTDGVYVGGECVVNGDTTGPRSARTVLQDPEVEAAVLETARGGMIRGGLGYDLADVGIVTNISDDHLGQDGIIDLDDLAWVKSLVVEAIKPDGTAVLNADDTRVLAMAERARCRLAYFSLEADNIFLRKHCSEGGLGVYVKGGAITATHDGKEEKIASLRSIPCVLGGKAIHNIQNALAATAAALAVGVSVEVVRSALKGFAKNPEQNPGRFNLIALGDVRLVVDYGHNAAGYEAAIRTARQLAPARLIGVIGSPGDRLDEAIVNLGRVAGKGFELVFVKEDADLRGRASGEVAELLRLGAAESGLEDSAIRVILSEGEAIREALKAARAGDIVLVFYEKLETVMAAVEEVRSEIAARPAAVDLAIAEPSVG